MKSIILTAAVASVLSIGSGALAAPPPVDRGEMVRAIVVLDAQVDPSTIVAPSRRQRRAALVRALRARAGADQTGVRSLLSRRRAQGLVADVVPLWVVNAVAVVARPSVITELARRPEVREIDPDLALQAPAAPTAAATAGTLTEPNVDAVNAPALWDLGIRGQGTVVATMDTGVDAGHPDLAARWRGGNNSWYDPNGEHPTVPTDVNGHGTATMGVLVGGAAGGTAVGVAPDATWIAVKIFNDRGTTSTSRIHQGFHWLLDPDGNPDTADAPDVVNNSWTGSTAGCSLEFQPDLRNLRAAGILPVFAAGNYGPTAGTVLSPATNPEALAVGAIDDTAVIDPSSSRGPSACGQATVPRLVAPGVGIRTTDLYGGYVDATGTSVAAPHVAGALALLLSAAPELPADRQQAALESTAGDLGPGGADTTYGYGRVDTLAAYRWLGTAPDYSVAVSPAQGTTAPGGAASYTVSVTPVNGFTGDVTFGLTGLPAQASWSFSPPVIAGGNGAARLDVATTSSIAPGTYRLTITATGGGLTRTTTANLVITAPPDYAVAAAPPSSSVVAGAGAAYTVTVSSINGFAGNVGLTVAGLSGTVGTASISPSTIAAAGTAQLTIATVPTAPPGTYPVTVTGTSGSTSHSTTVTLQVKPPPDFTLTAAPSSATVLRRQTASFTVSTSTVGGFTGSATLSVSGLPGGSSAGFAPNPAAVPGSSTLRVVTTGQTVRGTFTLRISAVAGGLSHQTTVTLTIR
jgi:subtilisin family serine protease